jgi:succinyl-diaminopimelate desuccinylase
VADLLALTADLVAIPSVSREERAITEMLRSQLEQVPSLELAQVGCNLVARTHLGRSTRLIIAGHTDTVPINDNGEPRIEGDTLWGCGASDMKSGVAVMLELARTVPEPCVDVTYIFYEAEEIDAVHNGLARLFRERPDLVEGDVALLGEPTDGAIEAGCQGTMRAEIVLGGARAHTARPWMGRNAIQRLAPVLTRLSDYRERRPVIDGCEYREAVQAVLVEGGVAGNVVPDRARLLVNHRFAPDRSPADAEAMLRDLLFAADSEEDGDSFAIIDCAPAAAPSLTHPVLRTLIERSGLEVRAKLGWTDVARFTEHGIPAANFGPGDATLAHTRDEHVTRAPIEATYAALCDLLTGDPPS